MASIRTAGLAKNFGGLRADVSEIAAVVIFALIIFHVAVGWKVLRLSGRPARSLVSPMPARGAVR